MTTHKVWLITGAGRGMGVDIAKAALAHGYKVVATGRKTDKVTLAVGKSADLLVAKLDITKPADAESAVRAAVDRFGRIDVLVNSGESEKLLGRWFADRPADVTDRVVLATKALRDWARRQ
jgi:NAD(P)-dependent dehydrogenase (short-subunit alcohol dehydrogenase family)